jgi:peroxiredoxin
LEPAETEFVRRRAGLWVIAAQKPSGLSDPRGLLSKRRWFPILLDADRSVSKAYGVYHALSVDAYRIARPSAFVTGKERRISFIFVSSNQWERVALADLLAVLERA